MAKKNVIMLYTTKVNTRYIPWCLTCVYVTCIHVVHYSLCCIQMVFIKVQYGKNTENILFTKLISFVDLINVLVNSFRFV